MQGSFDSPNICFNKKIGSGMVNPTNAHLTYGLGNRWAHGAVHHTAFYTILAPNQPSCIRFLSEGSNDWALVAASSLHAGGVNVALCDASVRFINESIDAGDPAVDPQTATGLISDAYLSYGGASIHGVWGALGTAGGAENVPVP
jgi:hypothetical protein